MTKVKRPYISIETQKEMHKFFVEKAAPKYFLLQIMASTLKKYASDKEANS